MMQYRRPMWKPEYDEPLPAGTSPRAIGKRIARYRYGVRLTQDTLAKKCDVSRETITQWERGTCYPATPKVILLSKHLGVTTDAILLGPTP